MQIIPYVLPLRNFEFIADKFKTEELLAYESLVSKIKIRLIIIIIISGLPRNFFGGGGCSTNSAEDRGQRERGSGGGSPLVRGSGHSCNLVQEMKFLVVKFSSFLVL